MPDKLLKAKDLDSLKSWVNQKYKVTPTGVSQSLRDQMINGLNDAKMQTMYDKHSTKDDLIAVYDDDPEKGLGLIIKKLCFRAKNTQGTQNLKEFAHMVSSSHDPITGLAKAGTWSFNYNA